MRSDTYYAKIFGVKKEHTTPVSAQNVEIEANRAKVDRSANFSSRIRRRFYHMVGYGGTLIKHGWIDGRELSLIRWNEELRNSQRKRAT